MCYIWYSISIIKTHDKSKKVFEQSCKTWTLQQNRATDSKKTRQKVKEDNDRILVEGEPNGTSMEVDQNPNPVGAPMQDDPIFPPVVPYHGKTFGDMMPCPTKIFYVISEVSALVL